MSTEHNYNQFLTQVYVIEQKGLSPDQFTEKILRLVKEANRKVILSLIPIKDDIVLDGTKFFFDAQDVAYLYFDSEYERIIEKLTEESKVTFTRYKEATNVLVNAIKAQPQEAKRSKPVTVSCAYSSTLLESINGITNDAQNIIPS